MGVVDVSRREVVPQVLNVLGEMDRKIFENGDGTLGGEDVAVNLAERDIG